MYVIFHYPPLWFFTMGVCDFHKGCIWLFGKVYIPLSPTERIMLRWGWHHTAHWIASFSNGVHSK